MPQPVDMLSEISRTIMAERVQEAATRGNMAALQNAQEQLKAEGRAKETQVGKTTESENPEVDAKGKRKNPFVKRKKKKRSAHDGDDPSHVFYSAGEEKTVVDDPNDHDLDISV
ncbi:MAG: hypothetical protein COA73_02715 [Candidatus Hydrogenedentota bacterium]|nr:MAG: hypothetical protein COA73_02715 [Candidatus Hydrogenedentota bacterium]